MEEAIKRKSFFLDSASVPKANEVFLDFLSFKKRAKQPGRSLFFSRKGLFENFFTEDSGLYITPREYETLGRGGKISRMAGRMDSLTPRISEENHVYSLGRNDFLYLNIKKRYSKTRNYLADLVSGSVRGLTPARMWNVSIVGAVIFGMFTMTMFYRYLGQGVSAKIKETKKEAEAMMSEEEPRLAVNGKVLDRNRGTDANDEIDVEFITQTLLENYQNKTQEELEADILKMVKGYPIEKMVPEIAKKDRTIAAFLVGIAKKESNWGRRVPVLDGEDCFNYWGYRGKRDKMGTGGHTCFNSPKDAVDTVARRIEFLVSNENLTTPSKMVVWKCGYDCSWDNKNAVKKWIADVDMYFKKLDN